MTDDQRELWCIDRFFQTVTLYKELPTLDKAIQFLKSRDFIVHEFDCREYPTQGAILSDVLHRLNLLPQNISEPFINLVSFWDSLRDVEIPQETGSLLVFKYFDSLHRKDPECAQGMLGSIARENFYQRGHSRRFTACAHSVDPGLKLEPLYTFTMEAQWGKEDFDQQAKDRFLAEFVAQKAARAAVWEKAAQTLSAKFHLDLNEWHIRSALGQVRHIRGDGGKSYPDIDANTIVTLLRDFDFDTLIKKAIMAEEARDQGKRTVFPSKTDMPT